MKILCVGMNYAQHVNQDLVGQRVPLDNKNAANPLLPTEPVIFTKPDSALILKGKPFFVPDFAQRFDYETELVVCIDRLGKDIAPRFAHRYYSRVTVGIDFTARDLQERLRRQGLPWDICKGFDQGAAVGQWIDKTELPDIQDLHFRLDIDQQTVQRGHTADMLFRVDEIIAWCSRFFTLKMGDLIFTGTPAGVGPVHEGQRLTAFLEDRQVLDLRIK